MAFNKETHNDAFDLYGEQYHIVEPTCLDELLKAFEIRNMIQSYFLSLNSEDPDKNYWYRILGEQDGNIQTYLDNLGEFDNTVLINNVSYLAKKSGMRFGDLESALGLSAGYISRTAKTDSKKRMSIDVVWKIAKLFEIELSSLIGRDLSVPEHGVDVLVKFIEKLTTKTIASEIVWENHGGYMCSLNSRYVSLGLAKIEDGDDVASYTADVSRDNEDDDREFHWYLASDIYCYRNFQDGKDLVIFNYATPSLKNYEAFDFFLVWKENGRSKSDRLFNTADDAFAGLRDRAAELVSRISGLEFEPKMTKEHRNLIESFLKEGD